MQLVAVNDIRLVDKKLHVRNFEQVMNSEQEFNIGDRMFQDSSLGSRTQKSNLP